MDARTDGRTGKQMDGHTDRTTVIRTDRLINRQTDRQTDRRTDGRTDRSIGSRKGGTNASLTDTEKNLLCVKSIEMYSIYFSV